MSEQTPARRRRSSFNRRASAAFSGCPPSATLRRFRSLLREAACLVRSLSRVTYPNPNPKPLAGTRVRTSADVFFRPHPHNPSRGGRKNCRQVPQLVLDTMIMEGEGASANIIVTQPRRISAVGVAERIAAERAERIGETAGYVRERSSTGEKQFGVPRRRIVPLEAQAAVGREKRPAGIYSSRCGELLYPLCGVVLSAAGSCSSLQYVGLFFPLRGVLPAVAAPGPFVTRKKKKSEGGDRDANNKPTGHHLPFLLLFPRQRFGCFEGLPPRMTMVPAETPGDISFLFML